MKTHTAYDVLRARVEGRILGFKQALRTRGDAFTASERNRKKLAEWEKTLRFMDVEHLKQTTSSDRAKSA